jgi:hypothetical protein
MGMYLEIHAVTPGGIAEALALENAPSLKLPGEGTASSLSLEKSWHGLHYLLTGSAWEGEPPLGFLLRGGERVGEDQGYGPARLFQPAEVQQIDSALSRISNDQLWSRFNPTQMEQLQIYPGIWDKPEADLQEEYLGYFEQLKQLVRRARDGGLALLVVMS